MNARRQLRAAVFARDGGRCTECNLDTEAIRQAYEDAEEKEQSLQWCVRCDTPRDGNEPCAICNGRRFKRDKTAIYRAPVVDLMANHGYSKSFLLAYLKPHTRRSLWEAHHAVALWEGGTDDLSALVTLCVPCHGRISSSHASRRAKNERYRRKCRVCVGGSPCLKHLRQI